MASLTSSNASNWRRECSAGAASGVSGAEMTGSGIASRIASASPRAQPMLLRPAKENARVESPQLNSLRIAAKLGVRFRFTLRGRRFSPGNRTNLAPDDERQIDRKQHPL